jgi:hypothetical protein
MPFRSLFPPFSFCLLSQEQISGFQKVRSLLEAGLLLGLLLRRYSLFQVFRDFGLLLQTFSFQE